MFCTRRHCFQAWSKTNQCRWVLVFLLWALNIVTFNLGNFSRKIFHRPQNREARTFCPHKSCIFYKFWENFARKFAWNRTGFRLLGNDNLSTTSHCWRWNKKNLIVLHHQTVFNQFKQPMNDGRSRNHKEENVWIVSESRRYLSCVSIDGKN